MNEPTTDIGLAENLLSLSRSMLSAAQSAHWDGLERMEEQRRQLVLRLFSAMRTASGDEREVVSVLREVQGISEALMHLVTEERERVRQELLRLRSTRNAESAYAIALDGTVSD